ncbi:carboxypeptidase-like regulatory domain-containing protein [Natrinema ejinorense]|uniref:Carboxypeptidase regulatory-like domain-containing protein n=1 Tax=Natrinema ejinorense TaxID=373386 RepID=A0A2A5QXR1_9EURY|nr:carboxypeptidase-like regulatory domain-containing protein [Natrinema ejinorense]PCR91632.1 hypothetical protein CP557_14520 [Natrinema ejinorense]
MDTNRLAALSITVLVLVSIGGLSGVTAAESDLHRLQDDPVTESISSQETNETTNGTLTGMVADEDGDPISEATIRSSGTFVTNADGDGEFEIDLEPGEYTVIVTTSSHNRYTDQTVTIEANETTRQNVTFNTSAINETPTGTLTGTITDEDGDPISNSRVRSIGTFVATANDDGEFEIDLEPGEYNVTAIANGRDRRIDETVTIEVNETTRRNVTFNTSATGTLTGTVADEDGDPIPEATIRSSGTFVTDTDDDGAFEVDLEPGEYNVTAIANDRDRRTNGTVTVEANETSRRNFTLDTSATNETPGDETVESSVGTGNGTTAENETVTDSGDENDSGEDSVPGFGVTASLGALLGACLALGRS